MSLEVKYIDAPYGAQKSGVVQSTGQQPWSSNVLHGCDDIPFATFEGAIIKSSYDAGNLSISGFTQQYENGNLKIVSDKTRSFYNSGNLGITIMDDYRVNRWPLDGTRRIMPDRPKDIGWWSEAMSDTHGNFKSTVRLSIVFPYSYTATGLTITFNPSTNQWCSVYVSWYNGNLLLKKGYYKADSPVLTISELVDSFDRIVLSVDSTKKPFEFAKIQEITIGKSVKFGADEIISANISSEADNRLCELTVDTMQLEIHDRKSIALFPQENQRIELYHNNVLEAVHYIDNSEQSAPNFYKITCKSAIGLLGGTFLGGMYDKVPLATLVADILGEIKYEIDSNFSAETITGYLPACTRREALQQVAFAVGSLITTHGTDAVRFSPIPNSITSHFGDDAIFFGAKLERGKRYSRVEVMRHSYAKSSEAEELLNDENIHGSDVLITFNNPHYEYQITGGIITGSDVNWVTVTADGLVSISAKKYIHSIVPEYKTNKFATFSEQGNVVTVDGATLITDKNVLPSLNRLYDAVMLRNILTQDVVLTGQTCGEYVSSQNPWGTKTIGFITSMSTNYTQGGKTASITIRGE